MINETGDLIKLGEYIFKWIFFELELRKNVQKI